MQYQDAIEKSAADNFKYRSWFLPFFSNPDYFFISSYFLPSKNIWHYPDSLSIIRILSWLFWLCLNKPQTAGIESLTSWLGFSGFGHYCKTSSKEISPWLNILPSYFPWQHCSRGLPDNFTLMFAQQNWKNWMASNAVFQERGKCFTCQCLVSGELLWFWFWNAKTHLHPQYKQSKAWQSGRRWAELAKIWTLLSNFLRRVEQDQLQK